MIKTFFLHFFSVAHTIADAFNSLLMENMAVLIWSIHSMCVYDTYRVRCRKLNRSEKWIRANKTINSDDGNELQLKIYTYRKSKAMAKLLARTHIAHCTSHIVHGVCTYNIVTVHTSTFMNGVYAESIDNYAHLTRGVWNVCVCMCVTL